MAYGAKWRKPQPVPPDNGMGGVPQGPPQGPSGAPMDPMGPQEPQPALRAPQGHQPPEGGLMGPQPGVMPPAGTLEELLFPNQVHQYGAPQKRKVYG